MEIKDLAGLSQPLTRLIEVIAQGVGAVSRPYLIRQTADARAYEMRAIASALEDVAQNHHLPVTYKNGEVELWQKPEDATLILEPKSIDERSNLRLDYQERKRQANVENITSMAAIELATDEAVTSEKPDEDWVIRFFSSAQDVSSEQMQILWGRILAGEIRQPGTYSLRMLDFIKNLSKDEAELISKVSKLAIEEPLGEVFVDAHHEAWLQAERDISFLDYTRLNELGVLNPSTMHLQIFINSSINESFFIHGGQILLIKRGDISRKINLRIWKFTSIGKELLPLISTNTDTKYLEELGKFFVQHNGEAFIAEILQRLPNGNIKYQDLREVKVEASS